MSFEFGSIGRNSFISEIDAVNERNREIQKPNYEILITKPQSSDTFEQLSLEEKETLFKERAKIILERLRSNFEAISNKTKSVISDVSKPKMKESVIIREISEDEIPAEIRENQIKKGLIDEPSGKVNTKKTPEQLKKVHEKLEAKKAKQDTEELRFIPEESPINSKIKQDTEELRFIPEKSPINKNNNNSVYIIVPPELVGLDTQDDLNPLEDLNPIEIVNPFKEEDNSTSGDNY